MTVHFDMDGTIADFYGVKNWLESLMHEDVSPYVEAGTLVNMSQLARWIHKLQAKGYKVGIISWTSKSGSDLFNEEVALSKLCWLRQHLPSVEWDSIKIVNYGTPKQNFMTSDDDILFDDEEPNRNAWGKNAYAPDKIIEILKALA